MKVRHTTDGDITIVELLVQDLDVGVVGEIKTELEPVFGQGGRLIVDLKEVEFLDSSGAGLMVWLRRNAQAAGWELVLCNLSNQVRLVFDSLQFNRLFVIAGNREEAKLIDPTPNDPKRS
jgi:anti-anti-sigma factor